MFTYRAQAYRYRTLLEWAGQWSESDGQATLDSGFSHDTEDAARAYPELALTPAVRVEPRDYIDEYGDQFGLLVTDETHHLAADDRQPARLYEIITTDTTETYVSRRRRKGVSSSADS